MRCPDLLPFPYFPRLSHILSSCLVFSTNLFNFSKTLRESKQKWFYFCSRTQNGKRSSTGFDEWKKIIKYLKENIVTFYQSNFFIKSLKYCTVFCSGFFIRVSWSSALFTLIKKLFRERILLSNPSFQL